MEKMRLLMRATLSDLTGRVVARGPPVAHPWFKQAIENSKCWHYKNAIALLEDV